MNQLFERNNIDVPDFVRREKFVDRQGQCNIVQFEGNDSHYLVVKIKYISNIYDFYTNSDLSES